MDTSGRNETVLLIHGTWASPKSGKLQWYQPKHDFCSQLDLRLKDLGCAAKCWAHLKDNEREFFWNGEDSWSDWEAAAINLRKNLEQLINSGWKCHIVAHSHGGQVLLRAIKSLEKKKYDEGIGSLVLLGTPIFELLGVPYSPFPKEPAVFSLSKEEAIKILFPEDSNEPGISSSEQDRSNELLYKDLEWGLGDIGNIKMVRLLIINSEEDEAYNLIRGVLSTPNLFQEDGRLGALIWWRLQRWAVGWITFKPKRVKVSFKPDSNGAFKFENLSVAAVERGIANRQRCFGTAPDLFSYLLGAKTWSLAEIKNRIRKIFEEGVHSAYYTEPESINRIAEWIATDRKRRDEACDVVTDRAWETLSLQWGLA